MINITCNNKEVRSGTCADIGDSNVVAYISFFDTINNTERKLYQPVYGDFKTSTAYLFDLSGNSITLTYADSNKTRTELEDLLVDCCGCVGGDGTVTSFSAGNLSPLFTTNVATPTTTPALSFNLSNCNQYQVFGRVVAGTGAPSYVSLNPIAFNGLSLPNNQIAYGTGSGISSNVNLKYNGNSGLQIGGGTNTAYCAINIGNGVITNNSDFSFVLTENTANVISGPGNAVASFIIGSGNTITTGGIYSSAYHNKIFGFNNSISAAPSKYAMYNFISGRDNIVTDGYYNNILGHNVTINGYGGCLALTDYGGSITLTASNQFTARFSGGYRFMKDGSTQWMAIAPTTGYVTINNIPTAASATDILVSNGGVVSTRTVASLGIPVITPAALTKTNDTNVTISLGGTPATALLEAVSLTLGWTGILAIGRGGTGLGTLGTVNQLLRVNSGGTALEYFSPTWTSNTGTVTSVAASVGGTALGVSGTPITSSGTLAFAWAGTSGQYVDGQGNLQNFPAIPAGTVTSVALALPSNTFDISGSPVTSLGTLTGAFKSQIKKTVLAAPWGADGTPIWRQLQTSDLQQNGATTGQVITWNGTEWAAANPTGGVTSVAAGNGMNFTTITATGSVVLGTPSSITLSSTNSVTSTSHTHAFVPGGTSSQYIRGDGVLQTFPTIPSVAGKYVALSDADAGYSGQLSAVNLNDYTKTQVIYSNGNVTNNPSANSYVVWIGSVANNYGAQMAINPSVSDKFFFRNNYNTSWSSWYQVASREWVISQNYITSNQTITLSGDVTGSGATSITTTIAANAVTTAKIANTAVTFAKFQNINTNRLLGRSTAGSGSVEEISIGSGLSLSGGTLSASGGGGSAVWKVQGGSTDATTNTQNIYHNANVWLGDGSGSSSSYRLHVSGISYFTGSMTLNNITSIQAWNNAASQQLKIAQLDSSNIFNYAENYLKIVGQGGQAGDITISAYPHTRKDYISAYPRNVLVTNSSGNLLSLPGECYKNDNVNTALSSDESHSADSTWRTVTWDTVNTPSWSQYGIDTTSGNMKMKLPTSTYEYGTHLIFVTINYTGGTSSEVNAEIRINGSTVIGSATTNATASKNTLTFFTVIDNNATYQGSVISLHIRVATGTGSITVTSGSKMVMIAAGAPLPA